INRNSMKKLSYAVSTLAAIVCAMLLTGCNTVSVTTTQAIGAPTYPPTPPATVEILRTEPTRPHVRLGEVQAEPATESVSAQKIELALQKGAAKLGANAAVVVCDKTEVVGAVVNGPWWGRSIDTIQGRVVIAVAIRYQ